MKKFLIIFCILIIIILSIVIIVFNYNKKANSIFGDVVSNKKNYSIVYISGNKNLNENIERYYIVDSNNTIIHQIQVITGYDDKTLNELYNSLKENEGKLEYGKYNEYEIKIRDKSLVYSTIINNGKNINDVIDTFKNDTGYSNLIIKEF